MPRPAPCAERPAQPGSEALFSPPHLLWSPCSGGNEGVIPSRLLHWKMGNLAHGKPAESAAWICAIQDRHGNFTFRPSSQEKEKNQLSVPARPLTSPNSLLLAAVTSQYPGPWGRGKDPSQHLSKIPPPGTACIIMSEKRFSSTALCIRPRSKHTFF